MAWVATGGSSVAFSVTEALKQKNPTQRARDAGGGLWRPSRVARRMHATNSLTVRRDGSMTSAIALRHELRLPLLLGLLDNQSHNHEQMDVFHLLLG